MTTKLHALRSITERYLIVEGEGQVEIEGLEGWHHVRAGDLVFIPAGPRQRIRNLGSRDLTFYCFCTPRFEAGCYVDLEES